MRSQTLPNKVVLSQDKAFSNLNLHRWELGFHSVVALQSYPPQMFFKSKYQKLHFQNLASLYSKQY